MLKSGWKPLIYTCDCEGDFMRWNGQIFPNNVIGYIFDVQLKNGIVHFGCLVRARYGNATADAITQNGDVIELQHEDLLRPAVVDKETEEKLRGMAFGLLVAENRARRIKELEYRRSELVVELAKVESELAKLKPQHKEDDK